MPGLLRCTRPLGMPLMAPPCWGPPRIAIPLKLAADLPPLNGPLAAPNNINTRLTAHVSFFEQYMWTSLSSIARFVRYGKSHGKIPNTQPT